MANLQTSMAVQKGLTTQLTKLRDIRPLRPGVSYTEHQLRADANASGSRVVEQPWSDITNTWKLLDAASQAEVQSKISRGQPALVYRRAVTGEGTGMVPVQFIPVKLLGKAV